MVVGESDRQTQAAAVARRIFATLSTKWALTVIEAIGLGERRFAELHRSVDGISYKMLTQTLRGLEADGIVARHDHQSANPRVDYSLTAAGIDLLTTVHALCAWSRTHLEALLEANPATE
ncbi:winged helix-turn-helix transcriptional regulator [Nocardia neocaledoniensis]|uniref:winged helix-turn-helix transcriptional regulator n=1 Tax=Nocardia neocaledoniensis TaxID=236511 RepID=UPI00245414B2|nr:helix-turn-helix domain-containing protein [Nocardia neocaledoniensis]